MSPIPVMEATDRYFLPGTTKVIVVPSIADLAAGPTRLELNAGTDVSDEVSSISGWMITSESVPTPDLGKRFVSSVTGRLTAASSGLQFWADKAGVDIRELLVIDQETHIVFLDGGDVENNPMDVFKVTVASVGKLREIEGAGRIDTSYTIRDFAENLTVPAAA
jgi:hypothetical protein